VRDGIVFFLRPHQSLLKDDGVRAGVSWDAVLRIDGMVKLMLEQHGISYLPLESVSMQERVRAVEFVLDRCGLAKAVTKPERTRRQTLPPVPASVSPLKATIESWPHMLVDNGEHGA
jgi:hypothetical protein